MSQTEATDKSNPSSSDVELARESSRVLRDVPLTAGTIHLSLEGVGVKVPRIVAQMVIKALIEVARGRSVATVAVDGELTTQEAAELLNVSRPFVTKLLDERKIPSRRVGTHRRLLVSDVLAYKQYSESDRRTALDELTAQAQELGMGY